MFQVHYGNPKWCYKITAPKYTVYKIHVVHENETYFLLYVGGKWIWVNANETCPA